MRKLFYERLVDSLKPAEQSEWGFFIDQMERSYEALREAVQDATQDDAGRPVFFYKETGARDGKGSLRLSLRYIEAMTGHSKCLNYVTAILLSGTTLFEPSEGLIVDQTVYSGGRDVIAALSCKSDPVQNRPDLIAVRRE